MEPYRNIAGGSGVRVNEIRAGYITIEFGDGAVYRNTYASAGQGLNTFLDTTLRKMYERKEK